MLWSGKSPRSVFYVKFALLILIQAIAVAALICAALNTNGGALAFGLKESYPSVFAHVQARKNISLGSDFPAAKSLTGIEKHAHLQGTEIIQSHIFKTENQCGKAVRKVIAEYQRRGVRPEQIMMPLERDKQDVLVQIDIGAGKDFNLACVKNGIGTQTAYLHYRR
jgi:hypothetical protein